MNTDAISCEKFLIIKIWDAMKDISDKRIVYFIANKLGSTTQPV